MRHETVIDVPEAAPQGEMVMHFPELDMWCRAPSEQSNPHIPRQRQHPEEEAEAGARMQAARPLGAAALVSDTAPPARKNNPPDKITKENWKLAAECKDVGNPDIFFAKNKKDPELMLAKRICGGCAVRNICLRYAYENDEKHGTWGGLTTKERKARRASSLRGANQHS